MIRYFGFIALLAAWTANAQQRLPAGYALGPQVVLADSLSETRVGGRFRITIQRTARDSTERQVLDLAERLVPPRDEIERATSKWTGSGWVRAFAEAAKVPGARWWW